MRRHLQYLKYVLRHKWFVFLFGGIHRCEVYASSGSISYNRLPKRWRDEADKNGYYLDGWMAQKQRRSGW